MALIEEEVPPLIIQFAHGLESGPNGQKMQMLKKKRKGERTVEVVAPDMLGLIQSARSWALGRVLVLLVATVGIFVWFVLWSDSTNRTRNVYATTLLSTVLFFLAASFLVVVYTARRLLQDCVDLHRHAIQNQKPDLLMGSSFGGAIVARLATLGVYRGPILLLAPAPFRVDWFTWLGASAFVAIPSPALVVHGSKDTVVPLADSERLVALNPRIELLIVGDNHPLRYTYKQHHREWIQRAMELYESSNEEKNH
jgi:fermentation-respiration switch protein FrsA (DUF1100 family)